MELLLIPVPIFDKDAVVNSYLFRYSVDHMDSGGMAHLLLLDALNMGGITAFTGGKPIFVPVKRADLLDNLDRQCMQPSHKVVFLVEDVIPDEEPYLSNIDNLQSQGYQIAMQGYPNRDEPEAVLKRLDYLFLHPNTMNLSNRKAIAISYRRLNKSMLLVASGIATPEEMERAAKDRVHLFEGQFYKVPITQGETKITPLKANLIHLLNVVRDENFEFSTIAGIVQRDTALSLSLMRFVNSPYIGVRNKIRTIQHAVTILGQLEVRKWVTAAVFKSMATDRPSELTRLSLVRAKFAENLARPFGLGRDSESLFLMGMFSMLDLILQTPMSDALNSISMSDDIQNALLGQEGRYSPVLRFLLSYEMADWTEIHRVIQERGMLVEDINEAYTDAIAWYHHLVSDRVRPAK